MTPPPFNPGPFATTAKSFGRPLTVVELSVLLEELDRVMGELEESLTELALPFDMASRGVASSAIAAARRAA